MKLFSLKRESVSDKLKLVIDENMEENAPDFKERIAVSMKKDFLQEIYQTVSYDCQDSSEKTVSEKKKTSVLIDFLENFKRLILGRENWLTDELLGSELWSHLTSPAKGKTKGGRMRQFKQYKKDTIAELISVIRNLHLHFDEQPVIIRKIILRSDKDLSLSSPESLSKFFNFWEEKFPFFMENLYTVFSFLELPSLKGYYPSKEENDDHIRCEPLSEDLESDSDPGYLSNDSKTEDIHSSASATWSSEHAEVSLLMEKFGEAHKALLRDEEHPNDHKTKLVKWQEEMVEKFVSSEKMEERPQPRNIIQQVSIRRYVLTQWANKLTDECTLSEFKSLAVGHGCYLSFEKNRLMLLADSHPLIYCIKQDGNIIGNCMITVGFKNTVALFPENNQLEVILTTADRQQDSSVQIFISKIE